MNDNVAVANPNPTPADSVSADCNGVVLHIGDVVEVTTWGFVDGVLPRLPVVDVVTADGRGTLLTLWNGHHAGAYVLHQQERVWTSPRHMRKVTDAD